MSLHFTDTVEKEKIQIESEVEQRKQLKHIARIRPHRGHKMFKINDKGIFELTEQDYENDAILTKGKIRKRVIIEPNTYYISALNKKNAIKKAEKQLL